MIIVSDFQIGSTLFYVVVGLGGGILVTLTFIIMMCVVICLARRRKGSCVTATAQLKETHNSVKEHVQLQNQGIIHMVEYTLLYDNMITFKFR